MVEFRDRESLKKWLEGRDRADAVAIAARAALRVAPLTVHLSQQDPDKWAKDLISQSFRASSISWVAAVGPTHDIGMAANALSEFSSGAPIAAIAIATNAATDDAFSAFSASASAAAAFSTAAASTAKAATVTASWANVSLDAGALENGERASDLITRPLWSQTAPAPDRILEDWQTLRTLLLERTDEDWGVWTDWYDARLAGGGYINSELETARVLIPDKMWKQGPKVVNAEIRRLMAVHQPPRADQEGAVSPQTTVTDDGRLDVQPNPTYDAPKASDELRTLPARQRAIIRALLAEVKSNTNFSPVVAVALEDYDAEIVARGTRPMLGLLKDLHQIVRDEYLLQNREKYFEGGGGLKRTFLLFTANHKQIVAHFPLDHVREDMNRQIVIPPEITDPAEVKPRLDALDSAIREAGDEAATRDFQNVARIFSDELRWSTTVPPPSGEPLSADPEDIEAQKEIRRQKRAVISMRGFAGVTYRRLMDSVAISAFFETERGKAVIEAFRALVEWLCKP